VAPDLGAGALLAGDDEADAGWAGSGGPAVDVRMQATGMFTPGRSG
jgi:hypothetical protein